MESNQILLEKIEKHTRKQAALTRFIAILCAVAMICMLVMTVCIVGAAGQIVKLTEDAGFVLDNLSSVSWELANADIGTMLENMGALAADSQTIVSEAMKKLDAMDVEALNSAIRDLADIVEPLAKVSNFFG